MGHTSVFKVQHFQKENIVWVNIPYNPGKYWSSFWYFKEDFTSQFFWKGIKSEANNKIKCKEAFDFAFSLSLSLSILWKQQKIELNGFFWEKHSHTKLMDFPPNWTALAYFSHFIHIHWYVDIFTNEEDWIMQLNKSSNTSGRHKISLKWQSCAVIIFSKTQLSILLNLVC